MNAVNQTSNCVNSTTGQQQTAKSLGINPRKLGLSPRQLSGKTDLEKAAAFRKAARRLFWLASQLEVRS